MDFNELIRIAGNKQIIINEEMERKLLKYYEMIVEYNQKFNLTAIVEQSDVLEKHFFDSMMPILTIDLNDKKLLDMGTGAGFPGIVIKIVSPSTKVTLLDSNRKKVDFLNRVIEELQLNFIETVVSRAEDYVRCNQEIFDIIISRAMSSLPIFMELATPALKIRGFLVSMKGLKFDQEKEKAKNACKLLELEYVDDYIYQLPESGAERHNLIYIKNKRTNKKYPRHYSTIIKRPL